MIRLASQEVCRYRVQSLEIVGIVMEIANLPTRLVANRMSQAVIVIVMTGIETGVRNRRG